MLTRLERFAFRLNTRGFFYLPSHPAQWNKNYTRLSIVPSQSSRISYLASLMLNVIVSAACLYIVLSHLWIKPRDHYHIGFVGLHISAVMACGAFPLATFILFRHNEMLLGFNESIQFENHLPADMRRRMRGDGKTTLLEWGILSLVTWCIPAPFVIMVSSLYFRFDPFYFIFNDLFSSYPDLLTPATKLFSFLVRVIATAAGFECGRSLPLILACGAMITTRNSRLVYFYDKVSLTEDKDHDNVILKSYQRFRYNTMIYREGILNLLSLGISSGFWGFVVAGWITIRGRGIIDPFMYLITSSLVVVDAVITFSLVSDLSRLSDTMDSIYSRWSQEARGLYIHFRRTARWKEMKILWKRATSCRQIPLYYKPFLNIDRTFCIDFSDSAVNRLIDAICIF